MTSLLVEAGIAGGAAALAVLLTGLYRSDPRYYGAPSRTDRERSESPPHPYRRDDLAKPLTAHAAYLRGPRSIPGVVALTLLVAKGHVQIKADRCFSVGTGEGLDPFQQIAFNRSQGIRAPYIDESVSTAIAPELEKQVGGTRLATPAGAWSVPLATTTALWLALAGVAMVMLSVGGWFALLAPLTLWLGRRVTWKRSTAPGRRLSDAGRKALLQLERHLDSRIRGVAPHEYSNEEIALYVALKPLDHSLMPGVDDHFKPIIADDDGQPTHAPSLGPPCSQAELDAARRTNNLRAATRFSAGLGLLGGGLAFSAIWGLSVDAPTILSVVAIGLIAAVLIIRWRFEYDPPRG